TQYYIIQNPIIVEGDLFRACDKVTVEIHRKSLITTQAISVRELVIVKDNVEVARFKTDLAINLNEDIVHVEWDLPCTIKPGIYKFQGVVTYKFRGLDKSIEFYSTNFEVAVTKPSPSPKLFN
ncbi:MAG: hypothetical protein WA019_05200, partial [Candidatus Moraniibacteriota bacterium]